MFPFNGPTSDLLQAATWVFLFGLLIASRDLPLWGALLVAAIKVAIPLAYFWHDGFGQMHLADDLDYYYDALLLYQRGLTAGTFFGSPVGFSLLVQAVGGFHVAYPFWNLTAFSFFGPNYFSPVFLNIGLTFVAGWFFVRVMKGLGATFAYRTAALVFFLLHWDVIAWSSFLNLKDILVMTLTLAAIHQLVLFFKNPGMASLLIFAGVLAMLALVRFYAPAFLLGAACLHILLGRWKARSLPLVLVLVLGLVAFVAAYNVVILRNFSTVQPLAVPYGVVRFVMTPLPWNLEASYTYLLIPAVLHLIFLVPALLMLPFLWPRDREARLVFLYLMLVVGFYSVFANWQGPRQRLQADFVFIWMQFHALWMFAHYAAGPAPAPTPFLPANIPERLPPAGPQ